MAIRRLSYVITIEWMTLQGNPVEIPNSQLLWELLNINNVQYWKNRTYLSIIKSYIYLFGFDFLIDFPTQF